MTLIKDIINQNKRLANISKAISELSDETKINAFLVGGCVRDLMLNPLEEAIDVDIMVEGNGIDFAKKSFLLKNLQQLKFLITSLKLR